MKFNWVLKATVAITALALFLVCHSVWEDGRSVAKTDLHKSSGRGLPASVDGDPLQRVGSKPAPSRWAADLSATGSRRRRGSTSLGCGLDLGVSGGGRPLGGAMAMAESEDGAVYKAGPSGIDGRLFLDLPCGPQSVEVSASGYVPFRFETRLSPASLFSSREIDLLDAYGRWGRVVDDAGAPIAGAVASLTPVARESEVLPRRVETDVDGSYRIDLSMGTHRFRVSKIGFKSYSGLVDPSSVWEPLIVLVRSQPAGRFVGRVTGRDGRPIANAMVALRGVGASLETGSGRTGVEGRFDLAAPAGKQGSLLVSKEGCLDWRQSVDLAYPVERDIVLDCYPTFVVTVLDRAGHVVDNPRIAGQSASTGEPVVNCTPRGRCYSVQYPLLLQAASLESGLGVTSATVLRSYTPEVELRMDSSAALEGVVEDLQGRPVKSFTVQLRKPIFASARFKSEDGVFRLGSLPPGEALLAVAAPGYRPLQRSVTIPAKKGEADRRWRLTPLPASLRTPTETLQNHRRGATP